MSGNRVAFEELPWEGTSAGARSKSAARGGRKLRLAEFTDEFVEEGWCAKAHSGYVLEGEVEIAFPDRAESFGAGDGIFIDGGEAERHRLKVLGPRARLLLFEDEG